MTLSEICCEPLRARDYCHYSTRRRSFCKGLIRVMTPSVRTDGAYTSLHSPPAQEEEEDDEGEGEGEEIEDEDEDVDEGVSAASPST